MVPLYLLSLLFLHASSDSGEGRGIVMCMGPIETHFMGVYATAKLLRNELKSRLPIEVWTYAFELPQIPPSAVQALTDLGDLSIKTLPDPVPIVDAAIGGNSKRNTKNKKDKDILGGLKKTQKGRSWQTDYLHFSAKPLALLTTNLTEVMILDSDALIFVSPDELFNYSGYQRTGTFFLYDKFLDYFPYKGYDQNWMHNFISSFDRKLYENVPISTPGVVAVRGYPKSHESPLLSQYFVESSFHASSKVKTQHLAESSLLLFNKEKQHRAIAILRALTTVHHEQVYRQIYGDKESYWMACELAGSDYTFSPYGPSHWAALTTNGTCPDVVIDPTFLHYMPGEEMKALSMNQFKLRHIKKYDMSNSRKKAHKKRRKDNSGVGKEAVGELGGSGKILAISKRESRQSQIDGYLQSLHDCSAEIPNMRKVHRCWSRKVLCSAISDQDFGTLEKHGQLQIEARIIFRKMKYPCNGCYWKYKKENDVYYSEISSKVKGQKDVTFRTQEEFFAHREKMGYPPGSGWSELILVDE